MSGVEACTSITYSGPDAGPASLAGTCRDHAGNTSAALPFALNYDATAPSLTDVTAKAGDTTVTLRWRASEDATVTVVRAPDQVLFSGGGAEFLDARLRNGVAYTYAVSAADPAGNAVSSTVAATPNTRLLGPLPGAHLRRPSLLRWRAVQRARYYNVQVYRGARKVLSAWPSQPQLQLRRRWRYRGIRYRLVPGTYRWFVWPGYGRRGERRYGSVIGSRDFVIVPRA